MGKITGFLELERNDRNALSTKKRLKNYKEFVLSLDENKASEQGARCMDCGIPFCHSGCPVNNVIPDWNHLVYEQNWKQALDVLHSTNNFPEFTGKICPAPCEASCTLNLDDSPVTIKSIEHTIVEKGWKEGWIKPQKAKYKTGKKVAIIGSGPAGLSCAQQLVRFGHEVTVYEKSDRIGGLLRYGIPDFKMEKNHIDKRIDQMVQEGVVFKTNTFIGDKDFHNQLNIDKLISEYDAVVLACGAEKPRDLEVPGRDLNGIHFAMDFLPLQNKIVAGDNIDNYISAKGKNVIVIGGGDTGSDCVGTSNRQGAKSVTQFELMPMPPKKENKDLTWPNWPIKLRTSSSHEEGCLRDWAVATKRFEGKNNIEKIIAARVEWHKEPDGRMRMKETPGSEFEIKADLVLLAMGFLSPVYDGLLASLDVNLDNRGNIKTSEGGYKSSTEKVFAAGDVRRGQSLVVWAIREGRDCAEEVNKFCLRKKS